MNMTARELANIQMILWVAKKQLQFDTLCDRDHEDLIKVVYEVENFLEKQPVDTIPQEWKPYY